MDEAHAPIIAAARSEILTSGTPPRPEVTLQELLEALAHWVEQPQSHPVTTVLYQHSVAFFDIPNRITPAMISAWNNR